MRTRHKSHILHPKMFQCTIRACLGINLKQSFLHLNPSQVPLTPQKTWKKRTNHRNLTKMIFLQIESPDIKVQYSIMNLCFYSAQGIHFPCLPLSYFAFLAFLAFRLACTVMVPVLCLLCVFPVTEPPAGANVNQEIEADEISQPNVYSIKSDPVLSCDRCGKPASKNCSRCKSVRYCGPVCQKSSWF